MRKYLLYAFILYPIIAVCQIEPKAQFLKLWYDKPAQVWEEALPLGNGRIGAMVFGNPLNEFIQLNDNTLWSGYPVDGNNPKAKDSLAAIRQAINDGDYQKAAQLWKENAQGPYSARYLPLADLYLNMASKDSAKAVYRDLDISRALASVNFSANGVNYTRKSFISYPDQVMVIRLEADKEGAVEFDVSLGSKLKYNVQKGNDSSIILRGKAPKYVAHRSYEPEQIVYTQDEGTDFEVHLRVLPNGGHLINKDSVLTLVGANSATIILSTATSFNGFDKSPGKQGVNPNLKASSQIEAACKKTYAELLHNHIEDYQSLFSRVELSLGNSNNKNVLPTDERLKLFSKDDSDNGLVELYYQYGRYLTIASSRAAGLPSTLQGLWNPHIQPPWGSAYTVNINTQMNYWPAEITGLQECHKPLFDFLSSLSVNGNKTASVNYGIDKGWVAHHNSDIWSMSYTSGGYNSDKADIAHVTCWPMAGAWFVQHLWEHYAFGGDKKFLQTTAYPLMKGAAEFMLEWLQQDNETNYLVTNPSTSPENLFKYSKDGRIMYGGISKASTMDMAIIWDLFTNCIAASEVLGIDNDFRQQLIGARDRLYPPHLGAKGQLQEWFSDFEEQDTKHRHVSHLFGLHPGKEILPRVNPEFAAAAKQTLLLRGDGGTGWAMAWKINFWARLEDGNHAYLMLKNGLRHVDATDKTSKGGGTYSNLFDAHPPFQIDGNFGGTSGITEMLLQSHGGEIFLLPALPDNWVDGCVKGLRGRGGFVIDMEWENRKLTEVVIHSTLGGNCRLRSHEPLISNDLKIVPAIGENSNPFYFKGIAPDIIKGNNAGQLIDLELKETVLLDLNTERDSTYVLTVP